MNDDNPSDATSQSVVVGGTESGQPGEAPEGPSAAPDVNPDVVAHSAPASAADEATAAETKPSRPSLLDRIRALELRVTGSIHPDDDGTDDDDDDTATD